MNALRLVSIVDTRDNGDSGKNIYEKIVTDLINEEVIILSGFAFGIDSITHKIFKYSTP